MFGLDNNLKGSAAVIPFPQSVVTAEPVEVGRSFRDQYLQASHLSHEELFAALITLAEKADYMQAIINGSYHVCDSLVDRGKGLERHVQALEKSMEVAGKCLASHDALAPKQKGDRAAFIKIAREAVVFDPIPHGGWPEHFSK